jgi:hypothetical protein
MADRLRLLEGLLSVPVIAFWIFLPIALWRCRGEYNGDGLYRDRPQESRALLLRPHAEDRLVSRDSAPPRPEDDPACLGLSSRESLPRACRLLSP